MKTFLLSMASLLFGMTMVAQSPVELSLGGSLTQAKNGAFNIGLDLFKSSGSVLDSKQLIIGNNWYLYAAPQASIVYGNSDAFNGFVVKGSGFFRFFRLSSVEGIDVVDYTHVQEVIPFSVGTETNKDLKNFNVVGEIGFIPWWKTLPQKRPGMNKALKYLLNYSDAALFVQAGNKFGQWGSSDSLLTNSGDVIRSKEQIGKGLCRLKLYANFSPKLLESTDKKFQLFLHAEATYWHDFLNNGNYYQVIAKINLKFSKHIGFDFGYQKGSGAPNFNEGNQMTGNLIFSL